MKLQHYNKLNSAMWYIEEMLNEIELSLNEDETKSYKVVEIDLTKKQIDMIKKNLKLAYSTLRTLKKNFRLDIEPIKLSRIIDANTGFIWKTIEDTRPSRMEREYGKIKSADKKRQLDNSLSELLELANKIREIAKYEAL